MVLGITGCAADAVVVFDPVFAATADAGGVMTRRIRDISGRKRVRVIHATAPAAEELLVAIRSGGQADRVIVPGLLSGEIERLAPELPGVRFFLVDHARASEVAAGLTPITFDRTHAFSEAGRFIAEWAAQHQTMSPGVLLLFSEESAIRVAERDALLEALGDPPAVVRVEGFSTRPNRDRLRDVARWPEQSGPSIVGLFLSGANATAREVVTASAIVTEGSHAMTPRVVATVSNEFADGVAAALGADHETDGITIPAQFLRFSATGASGPQF
ncbi:MAG: hypothetical protein EA403_16795 [Spirochaetaceae bacterium]|nr:MAG: hypothetical protein EA403_16795 [Spirochaetaceae bacterium]